MQVCLRWVVLSSLFVAGQNTDRALVQIWDVNRTARAKDVERVLRRARRVSHAQRRTRATLKPKQCGGRVLYIPFENYIRCLRLDLCDRTKEIRQHLNSMTAEIEHRAAAGAILSQQPRARMIRRRIEELERVYLRDDRAANLSRRYQLFRARHDRIEMAVISHPKSDLVLTGCAD